MFKCVICPDLKGIIVKTNIGWVHLTCVNWMPEIWFKEGSENTIVEGHMSESRYKLTCKFCRGKNKKKLGACIQCDFKDCPSSFHVRCAID